MLASLLVGTGFAMTAAISPGFAASSLYAVLVWLPRVGFFASATLLLAYEPHHRWRIRRFVDRPGWTAEPAVERACGAVRSGATLLVPAAGEVGDFSGELLVNADLERVGVRYTSRSRRCQGGGSSFARPSGPIWPWPTCGWSCRSSLHRW